MQLTNTLFCLTAFAAAAANAQEGVTVKVTVGEDGVLQYSPNDLVAEVGTKIEFDFFPKNHTVTQSSFGDPCHPLAGGFFSGFVPEKSASGGSSFTITVNDTKRIWFYCGQTVGDHCQAGMVGAINAPTSGNTFENFAALAKSASISTSPPSGPVGGILKVGSNSISSSNTSSSTSASNSAYSTRADTSTYTTNVYGGPPTISQLRTIPPAATGASTPSTSGAHVTDAASELKVCSAVGVILAAAAAMLF